MTEPINDLPEMTDSLADNDRFVVDDVSDTTEHSTGTTKKLLWSKVKEILDLRYQAASESLSALAELVTTSFGRSLLATEDDDALALLTRTQDDERYSRLGASNTFTGTNSFTGLVTDFQGPVQLSGDNPQLVFYDEAADTADKSRFDWVLESNGDLTLYALSDDGSTSTTMLTIPHGGNVTIPSLDIPLEDLARKQIPSRLLKADQVYDSRFVNDDGTIENLGTGPDLDATIEGDIVTAEGPGVYSADDGQGAAAIFDTAFPATADKVRVRWHQHAVVAVDPAIDVNASPITIGADSSAGNAIVIYQRQNSGLSTMQMGVGWNDGSGTRDSATAIGSFGSWPDGDTWIEVEVDASGAQAVETLRVAPSESGPWTDAATVTISKTGLTVPDTSQVLIGGLGTTANRWAGFLSHASLYFDDVLTWKMPDDIEDDPNATINRATSGQTTTIVPAGRTFNINPDHTNTANKITTGGAPVVIAADQSAVLGWVGILGNYPGSTETVLAIGDTGVGTPDGLSLTRAEPYVYARLRWDGVTYQSVTGALLPDLYDLHASMVVIDRDADLLRFIRIARDGTVTEATPVSIASVGALTFTEGITTLLSLPGASDLFMSDKIESWADERQEIIAAFTATLQARNGELLTKPVADAFYTTQAENDGRYAPLDSADIFVPASDLVQTTGAATTGDMPWTPTIGLPQGLNVAVGSSLVVPPGWTNVGISVVWSPSSTDTGAARFRTITSSFTPGVDSGPGVEDFNSFQLRAAGGVADAFQTDSILSSEPVVAGDVFSFVVYRNGGGATDTFAGDVQLLGVLITNDTP